MKMESLLVEIGTEELPPKALDELSEAFARGVHDGLVRRGLATAESAVRRYATPRRLAVHVAAVAGAQEDQTIERRGPAVAAGRDAAGQPSRALLGFAESCGVAPDALKTLTTDKGSWYVHRAVQPGRSLGDLLPEVLAEAIKALPVPRPMRWGNHDYSFVRPVHWFVALHGAELVEGSILGVTASRASRGHRFHHPAAVEIPHADAWLEALRAARVLADPDERRARVRAEVARAAQGLAGAPRLDDALANEIANLTEWPVAVACAFDRDFLEVPFEALVTTMEANQKFVPVFAPDGALSEYFIGVANIDSKEPSEIRKGYERVIRPRFADARFFYQEDKKTSFASYQAELANVTYQQALGSLWDKSCRVAELARIIANRVGVDAGRATRAASLAKCDLLTRMVGEFPELQGIMGRYLARARGEADDIADALDEHYQPRHAGDPIARGDVARVLAVAERLDTLAGIFAAGLKPSGSKDPFALRRAALGLARTLVEAGFDIDLHAILHEALELIPDAAFAAGAKQQKDAAPIAVGTRRVELAAELATFIVERLRGYYADQGFAPEHFEAVAAVSPASLADFDQRLRAIADFARRPEAVSLAAANKRVANILRKEADDSARAAVDAGLFEDPAEHDLAAALEIAGTQADRLVAARDYTGALAHLATLQAPVDRYFDAVLVMADDPAVRANRLAQLTAMQRRFLAIADVAQLH